MQPMNHDQAPGTLVGVGVGPGDPELLTLQAIRALRSADRVTAPAIAHDVTGRAEQVVRAAVPDVEIIRLVFDMTPDSTPGGAEARDASHVSAAVAIAGWLASGETIAFVTLGDPNIYSTFPSLARAVARLHPSVRIETIPGICAFQALAARSGTVLLDGTESLALVTALDGTEHLAAALDDPERAVVVYKGGRHLPAISAMLESRGRLAKAVMGELIGMSGERLEPVARGARREASYLATVIVPPTSRGGGSAAAGTASAPSGEVP
ncbi:MAG: precorrin-2 C(20)-methyltransferase [Acidimicrobiales bacterium]